MLCQSLAHELAPAGVHVCHFVIDGAVDAPDTLGRMLGKELFAKFKASKGEDGVLQPEHRRDMARGKSAQEPSGQVNWTCDHQRKLRGSTQPSRRRSRTLIVH